MKQYHARNKTIFDCTKFYWDTLYVEYIQQVNDLEKLCVNTLSHFAIAVIINYKY